MEERHNLVANIAAQLLAPKISAMSEADAMQQIKSAVKIARAIVREAEQGASPTAAFVTTPDCNPNDFERG